MADVIISGMAGHSKWANIKRQKARVDAVKGKTFTQLSPAIIVAARNGVPDPAGNFQRTAIEKRGSWDTNEILTERLQRVQAHSEEKTRIWKLFATRVTVLEVLPY